MKRHTFRAYGKNNNMWFYGYISQYNKIRPIFNRKEFEIIPNTIGQFTGLKDKNGREIYEGDIVKMHNNIYSNDYYTVEWKLNGFYPFCGGAKISNMCEIIGNIHENPEIIKCYKLNKNLKATE